jgi:FtsP/CotA-like multicopper oxidase with cupredoxin domain
MDKPGRDNARSTSPSLKHGSHATRRHQQPAGSGGTSSRFRQRAVFLDNNARMVLVPGYFKMRSRFVDYTGQYVIHCHILAHEDRGMMTIVQVVPLTTPYSHQ